MTSTDSTQTENRCGRCGRKLRVSAGYGPKCRARIRKAAAELAVKPEQRDKALELIADGGLVAHGHRGVFRAVSSRGDVTYLVHRDACNCPAGLHDRFCYHRAAVALVLAA